MPDTQDIFEDYKSILAGYDADGRLRTIPPDRSGTGLIDLCSNDYLGLAACDYASVPQQITPADMSASASRLLASRQHDFDAVEKYLEKLYGRPALLFNSGYHLNVGCISALAVSGTVILSDKLIHASAIDGIRLSGAEYARWRHNDIGHLERLVEKYSPASKRILIVAEAIYSMDGDEVDLKGLVELKRRHPNVMLYLDEAHSFGVRGEKGLGLAEECGAIDDVDIIAGTLGKAGASAGAFAITTPLLRSFLVNTARSLIFSTGLPPVTARHTLANLRRIAEMREERKHLKEISARFRKAIHDITGEPTVSTSQIVPLHVGDAAKAVEMAAQLRLRGVDALAIRRPTVPPGGERIRFSLNASLDDEMIDRVISIVKDINRK